MLAEHRATDTVTVAGGGNEPASDPVRDIAEFLGSFPPFDTVGEDDLARIAAVTETEVIPRGKTIFSQGAGPVEYLWVVRSGSVEVIHDGRVLDLLGPGSCSGTRR